MKTPRSENIGILGMALLVTLGVAVPLMVGGLLIPVFNYVFFILLLGWIPYSIWAVLVRYYRRRDHIIEEKYPTH